MLGDFSQRGGYFVVVFLTQGIELLLVVESYDGEVVVVFDCDGLGCCHFGRDEWVRCMLWRSVMIFV